MCTTAHRVYPAEKKRHLINIWLQWCFSRKTTAADNGSPEWRLNALMQRITHSSLDSHHIPGCCCLLLSNKGPAFKRQLRIPLQLVRRVTQVHPAFFSPCWPQWLSERKGSSGIMQSQRKNRPRSCTNDYCCAVDAAFSWWSVLTFVNRCLFELCVTVFCLCQILTWI